MKPSQRLWKSALSFSLVLSAALVSSGGTPGSAEAATATVTATGRVVYNRSATETVPVRNAKVTLYDYDCVVPGMPLEWCRTQMESGWTDVNGEFTLTGTATDPDLCLGHVEGSYCCDGVYQSNCLLGTPYGDGRCCEGFYSDGECYGISFPLEMVCTGIWVPLDYPDPYIQVEATSPAGSVQTELLMVGGFTYCLRTGRHENARDGEILVFGDASGVISPDNAMPCCDPCPLPVDVGTEEPAWHLHNALQDVHDFMTPVIAANPGGSIPPVAVLWPSELSEFGEASFYDGGAIHIEREAQWADRTLYHEYGHHVLGSFADSPAPFYWNGVCDPPFPFAGHCAWRAEDGCLWPTPREGCVNTAHFTEAFSNFLSRAVVESRGKEKGWDWEVPMTADLFPNGCGWDPDNCPVAGEEPRFIEGISSAILWDLYDDAGLSPAESGTTMNLRGLWGSSPTEILAVGHEVILRYRGIAWAAESFPGDHFNDVWGTSASDVFVVGHGGRILHHDGVAWTEMASGTTEHLYGVWGASGTDVFAVGLSGTILHYDGSQWLPVPAVATDLHAVWGSSSTDVFAVGAGGTILHFDGAAWTEMTSGVWGLLSGVWGSSASDVYAVGSTYGSGKYHGYLHHYDGTRWSRVLETNSDLSAVWGTSPSDVYVGGGEDWTTDVSDRILHFDGSTWSAVNGDFPLLTDVEAIGGTSAKDVYFAGTGGRILHFGQDNHDTDHSTDRLHLSFQDIWDVIMNYDPDPRDEQPIIDVVENFPAVVTQLLFADHPVTIEQFYDGFRLAHPGRVNRLAEIYHENHIDMGLGANLVVDALATSLGTLSPAVLAGEAFTVTDTTANRGTAASELASAVRYYLHSSDSIPWDATQSGAAFLVGSRSVGSLPGGSPATPGSSSSGAAAAVVPYGVPAGTYWLHACADATGKVFERNEGDNCLAGDQVAVSYPDTDGDGLTDDIDSDDDGDGAPDANDCRPLDASFHPGATDVCDDLDNDCDGRIDEDALISRWYPDADADTYGGAGPGSWGCRAPLGYAGRGGDCDDANAFVNPGAAETCNSLDDDCDGFADNGPAEQCNGRDDDCDSLVDEDYQADSDGVADCFDNCPLESNPDQADGDGDGSGDVCDACPAVTGTGCDTNRSAGTSIGSGGGTLSTPDGSVTITVPPGAVNASTSLSITGAAGSFALGTAGGDATAYYGVTILPEGLAFNVPVTIVFSWPDSEPPPGKIDGTHINEADLVIYKDGVAITAACGEDPGCDRSANTFTVQVASLSDFVLAVPNGPPVAGPITAPIEPQQAGSGVAVSAPFTDPGFLDTHTATWDWGDGSSSTGSVLEAGGAGSVGGAHVYQTPGIYVVMLTVADNRGLTGAAEFRYVVVYDPNGGFVTGGGWISSPPGALARDPGLTGKATFGFVSQYRKGASAPSGSTEFQFDAGGLNFHSRQYDWMVVAGARAQFKGVGTVNGSGAFGFMLTATDGQVSGGGGVDRFRVKIWDSATGALVYDNQSGAGDTAEPTTAIAGGAITIHSGK